MNVTIISEWGQLIILILGLAGIWFKLVMSVKAIENRESERDRRIVILEEEFKTQRFHNDDIKKSLEEVRLTQLETKMDVGFIKNILEKKSE
jgi:hypothetical protein